MQSLGEWVRILIRKFKILQVKIFPMICLLGFAVLQTHCRHLHRPPLPRHASDFKHHQDVPFTAVATADSQDGVRLYGVYCQFCHGLLAENNIKNRTVMASKMALGEVPEMSALKVSDGELAAIVEALRAPATASIFACEESAGSIMLGTESLHPLSKTQYVNTLRDLFASYGVIDSLSLDLESIPIPQNKIDPFDNVELLLSATHMRTYAAIARKISESLLGQSPFISDAFGSPNCLTAIDLSRDCVTQLSNRFGQRILRRSVQVSDIDRALLLVGTEATAKEEAAMILYTWLMSGDFIYHMNAYGSRTKASSPELIELSSYELANRLAYGLWSSMPDQELFKLAADGSLKKPEILTAQIDRLLSHPKARVANAQFYVQWLQLKNQQAFNLPASLLDGLNLDESFKQDIANEANLFVNAISFDSQGSYVDLLSSPQNFAQSATYKSILSASSAEERPGILWRLVLASSTFNSHRNLIHSGAIIRERILCEPLPQPSPQLADAVKAATSLSLDELSSRDEVSKKTDTASCSICHSKINPLAFAAANPYDQLGRYIREERRLLNNGNIKRFAIEATVKDPNIDRPKEASLSGPLALALAIAKSKKGPACLVQKRFAALMGRAPQADGKRDGCVLKRAYEALESGKKGSLVEMLKLLLGPELRYRRLSSL